MTEEMRFFMYLVEYYAAYKNEKTSEVLRKWEERGIVQRYITAIGDIYE